MTKLRAIKTWAVNKFDDKNNTPKCALKASARSEHLRLRAIVGLVPDISMAFKHINNKYNRILARHYACNHKEMIAIGDTARWPTIPRLTRDYKKTSAVYLRNGAAWARGIGVHMRQDADGPLAW